MKNVNDEVWKISPRFPSYAISSKGRVKKIIPYRNSKKDGMIKLIPYSLYNGVSVSHNNVRSRAYVHRLVAEAFLGNCPDGHQVNHKDLNKKNNCIENLEYVTPRGNIQHAILSGAIKPWNKGKKTGLVPRSAFKPGCTPWNKKTAELGKEK